jgi:hypothetical protein
MVQLLGGSGRLWRLSEAGEILDHYVNSLEWRLPRDLWLDGTRLAWDARPQPDVVIRPGPGMLEGFVRLASEASDDAILRYARQWGPLWLCGHGLYWQHDRYECRPVPLSDERWYTRWEELQYWRDLAREARAVLRIARRLNAGALGDPRDWSVIPGRFERMDAMFVRWDELQWIDQHSEQLHEARVADDTLEQFAATAVQLERDERSRVEYLSPDHAWKWEVEPGGGTVEIHERLLTMVLDKWVDRGGVRPSVFRQNGRRSIRLGGYGLLGALAVQLVFDVCRTDGLAVCSSCGTPYLPPKRRPRQDQNSYCADCGLKAALRDAAARYRQTDKYRDARARRRGRRPRSEPGSDANPDKIVHRE